MANAARWFSAQSFHNSDEDPMPRMTTYQVQGTWPFATDMLRFDDARPATQQDSEAIARLSTEHLNDINDSKRPTTITLTTPREPNPQRWKSFGWKVVKINGEWVR
jgi:hypothetical protein